MFPFISKLFTPAWWRGLFTDRFFTKKASARIHIDIENPPELDEYSSLPKLSPNRDRTGMFSAFRQSDSGYDSPIQKLFPPTQKLSNRRLSSGNESDSRVGPAPEPAFIYDASGKLVSNPVSRQHSRSVSSPQTPRPR